MRGAPILDEPKATDAHEGPAGLGGWVLLAKFSLQRRRWQPRCVAATGLARRGRSGNAREGVLSKNPQAGLARWEVRVRACVSRNDGLGLMPSQSVTNMS